MAFIYKIPQLRATYYQFTKPVFFPRDRRLHGPDPSVLPATLHGRSTGAEGWTDPRERRFLEQYYTLDYNWKTTFEVILEAPPSIQDGTAVKRAGIKFLEAFRRRLVEEAGPSLYEMLSLNEACPDEYPEGTMEDEVSGHHFLCQGESGIQFRFTFSLPFLSTESERSLQQIANGLLGIWEGDLGKIGEPVRVRKISDPATWIRTLTQEIKTPFGPNASLPSRMWDAFGVLEKITPEVVDRAEDDLKLRFELADKKAGECAQSLAVVIRKFPCGVAVWE